jgi:hypothetical protein
MYGIPNVVLVTRFIFGQYSDYLYIAILRDMCVPLTMSPSLPSPFIACIVGLRFFFSIRKL